MKHAGLAFTLFISVILSISIVFAVEHKSNRDNEMKNALDVAIENTMDNLKRDHSYTIETSDQFIADFLEDFVIQIDSDSSVDVVVKSADMDAGILSIEVTMHYHYNNGAEGQVSTDRTVIFEHRQQKKEQVLHLQACSLFFQEPDMVLYVITQNIFPFFPK